MKLFLLGMMWLLGITAGRHLPLTGWQWLTLAAGAFLFALLFRRNQLHRWLFLLLIPLCLGAARYLPSEITKQPGHIAFYNDLDVKTTVTGVVVADPDVRDRYTALVLSVERVRIPQMGISKTVEGRILVRASRLTDWRYGDWVHAEGLLETPPEMEGFSYREYLGNQGIHSLMPTAYVRKIGSDRANPILSMIFNLRTNVHKAILRLFPEPEASLLSGILLGKESGIPPDLLEAYNRTGTTHIIAISGFNITLLAGLFITVFGRWFGARRGAWAAAAAIFFYTLLVGADPAVQRAAVMGGLALTARHLGRQTHGLASLSAAAIIMTLINPRTLWDVGFQLSFFATLGLILYADPLREGAIRFFNRWLTPKRSEKIANPISEFFLFTLAAQITTLPLTAIYFRRLSLVSVLANPVILPLQPLLMILGGLSSLLGALWIPLGQPIAWVAWLFPAFTNQAVRFFAEWPAASISLGSFGFPLVLAYYTLLLGGTWVLSLPPDRRPGRATLIRLQADTDLRLRLSLAALAIISGLTWHKLAHQPDGDLHITILDVGEGDAVLLRSPNGGSVLINGGSSPIRLTDLLSRYTSIFERELDWLIIGGTSYDQVGGLTRLSDHFVIRHSLIPRSSGKGSFQRVLEDLDKSSTPKTIYEPGHRLALGDGAFLEFLSVSDSGALIMIEWDSSRILLAPGADPALILESLDDPRLRSVSAVLLPAGGYAAVNPDEWLKHLDPGVILLSLRTGEMPAELPKNISGPLLNRSILRTDINGTIDLTTDGSKLWIEVDRVID